MAERERSEWRVATYEGRLEAAELHPLFDAIAEHMAHVERCLFVDLHVKGRELLEVKRESQVRFGITARQFNGIAFNLGGKVEAARASQEQRKESLERRIDSAKGWIKGRARRVKALTKRIATEERRISSPRCRRPADGPGLAAMVEKRQRLTEQMHHKRRHLADLERRLERVEQDLKDGRVRICFGSKELFHRQFHLEENGYRDHAGWLQDWRCRRASQFYCLGSRDESGGNQTLTHLGDGRLRLRVPDALAGRWGRWVTFPAPDFPYQGGEGRRTLEEVWKRGDTVSYRFLRRDNGRWYLQATVEAPEAERIVTFADGGAIGVDLNPDHVASIELDRSGNPLPGTVRRWPLALYKRSREQVEAGIGDAVAGLVETAKQAGKPIVAERLDFSAKKARLREEREKRGRRYARMLSGFACALFLTMLQARCLKQGVELILVKPAYTSLIGLVKFAQGYGLSTHQAAALAIGRRGMGRRRRRCRCQDRARCRHRPTPEGLGEAPRTKARTALCLPARNRRRHVWSDWWRHSTWLREAFSQGRRPSEGGQGGESGPPPRQHPSMGGAPAACERGHRAVLVPGCDSLAQVGTAVPPARRK